MKVPTLESMSKKTLSLLSFGILSLIMALNGLIRPNLGHSSVDSVALSYEKQLAKISSKYDRNPALRLQFDQSLDEYQKTDISNLEAIMYDLHQEREELKRSPSAAKEKVVQLEMISDAVLYSLLKRSYLQK